MTAGAGGGPAPAPRELVDLRTLRDWGRRYSNWGRWGPDDTLGTLRFVTPERVLAATRLPRSGLVVSCAWPVGAGGAEGGAGARWESLFEVSYDGLAWGGRAVAEPATAGAHPPRLDRLAGGVVGRGVLLDLPGRLRVPWLEDGTRIAPADLDACAEASGVAIETGDVLLVRTGRLTRAFARGAWHGYAEGPAPGLSLRCARWLHERQVAAVATDTAHLEVLPSEVEGCALPLHQIAVRDMGLLLGERFHLDPLAEACAEDGRYAFLFVAAPVAGPDAGAPLHPLAIK